MHIKLYSMIVAAGLISMVARAQSADKALNESKVFQVYSNRVVQGAFEARALSPTEIVSNYESPANAYADPLIIFKFSINGKDNEMPVGVDHRFACISDGASCETPLIVFGQQLRESRQIPQGTYLKPETKLRIKLDMREVFSQFSQRGYFENFNGTKIYKDDFKDVYVAGGTAPLTWDFDNLHNYRHLRLQDEDGDHIYELTLTLNSAKDRKMTSPRWKQTLNTSLYPQYTSGSVLQDAVYNLSLEEMIKAVEKDSTLRTGKEWAGVWTRDVSYSIILSMAILQTKVAQHSLLRKVKNGMIVQDTGTGGAYPVSTDRAIWAVAAWEIYKVTGDKKWLEECYLIVKKSLEADLLNAVDKETGMVKGESSFLDWREQTYPEWMQPVDIYESECLGTNAVHYQANRVLAMMAREVEDYATATRHNKVADQIKDGLNKFLWSEESGYYGQFLYGRLFKTLSPKAEALGEALTILFDIADPARQRRIVEKTPVGEFGIPCIFPHIPNIPPYHNNGVWPFVQSYWTMACAKAGNGNAVKESLASILRPAALFLTNKENFVAKDGDFAATQINSDNMLWSLSGNIAMVYKVIFGMQHTLAGLAFKPFIPEEMNATRRLVNFKYRDVTLDIKIEGYGSEIKHFFLDGKEIQEHLISSAMKGNHTLRIVMANNPISGAYNKVDFITSPESPNVVLSGSTLTWKRIDGAAEYTIFRNGKPVAHQQDLSFRIKEDIAAEFQVIAVGRGGIQSFASEPVRYVPNGFEIRQEVETSAQAEHLQKQHAGYSGSGYMKINKEALSNIAIAIDVPADGVYVVDFRYANGNGPINTENKCAIRTLTVDGKHPMCIVFPQRGRDEWSDWGYTNGVKMDLKKGIHRFELTYEPHNENMNGEINEAVVDFVRLTRIR